MGYAAYMSPQDAFIRCALILGDLRSRHSIVLFSGPLRAKACARTCARFSGPLHCSVFVHWRCPVPPFGVALLLRRAPHPLRSSRRGGRGGSGLPHTMGDVHGNAISFQPILVRLREARAIPVIGCQDDWDPPEEHKI